MSLFFLDNIKINAPLPTDWKYKVATKGMLVDTLSLPTNYPYKGQLSVVTDDVDDAKNGLYMLTKEPDHKKTNSGIVEADWQKLAKDVYIGTSTDTKPVLDIHNSGAFFFETDTTALFIWDGTQWVPIAGGSGGGVGFLEYDTYADLPIPGTDNLIYNVKYLEPAHTTVINVLYKWNSTDNIYEVLSPAYAGPVETVLPIDPSVNVGGVKIGIPVPAGTNLEEFINILVRPTLIPYSSSIYLGITNLTTTLVEVGSQYIGQIAYTFNQGTITSRNGSATIPLVEGENTTTFSGPGIDVGSGAIDTIAIEGKISWDMILTYFTGVGDYYDSSGTVSCIFNPTDTQIPGITCPGDGSRFEGSLTDTSNEVEGIYPFFFGGSPNDLSDGAGIYDLTTKLIEKKGNKSFNLQLTNAFIYIAYPSSYGILKKIFDGSNFDVTDTFIPTLGDVTSVMPGGTPYTEEYRIYKSDKVKNVDPVQEYSIEF